MKYSACTTYFGRISCHHQVLHLKHLEGEYPPLPPLHIDPWAVQPVPSRYYRLGIPALLSMLFISCVYHYAYEAETTFKLS